MRSDDKWWTWRWDRSDRPLVDLRFSKITRWRRGSFLTVYRVKFVAGGVQWWFYGPFNVCVGFGKG